MSVWTSSIPLENERISTVFQVRVGKDIWIIDEGETANDPTEVYALSTENQKLIKFNGDLGTTPSVILSTFAHNAVVYFWIGGLGNGHSLYTLDTNTFVYRHVKTFFEFNGVLMSSTIIGNYIYFLEYEWNSKAIQLCKINLIGHKVDVLVFKIIEVGIPYYYLKAIDNKLYLLEINNYTNVRKVFQIENNEFAQIHEERFRGVTLLDMNTNCFDAFMIRDTVDGDIDVYYVDTFDFNTMQWIRQDCEWHNNEIRSLVKIDDIVYAIIQSRTNSMGYEILLLEQRPSLTKLCILTVTDEILSSGDLTQFDVFERSLPPLLKEMAITMIPWRVQEYQYLTSMEETARYLCENEEIIIVDMDESQETMDP